MKFKNDNLELFKSGIWDCNYSNRIIIKFKNSAYLFLLLTWFINIAGAQTQPTSPSELPVISDLCYETKTISYTKVSAAVNFQSMEVLDIERLKTSFQHQKIRKYFVEDSYTSDVINITDTKKYPEWYIVADTIRTNREGIFSYFIKNNPILKGGWAGYQRNPRNPKASFVELDRGNRLNYRYHRMPLTEKQLDGFYQMDNLYRQRGFLVKIAWIRPDINIIKYWENNGYEVIETSTMIEAKNNKVKYTYDIINTTMTTEVYKDNGSIDFVTTNNYEYSTLFETQVITKQTVTTPITFTNGDCGETIVETIYENYGMACGEEGTQLRSMVKENFSKISLYPNPASENLTINCINEDIILGYNVFNVEGRDVLEGSNFTMNKIIDINLSKLESGYYTVRVLTKSGNLYSQKFVKI
jgi:hypothetical protein